MRIDDDKKSHEQKKVWKLFKAHPQKYVTVPAVMINGDIQCRMIQGDLYYDVWIFFMILEFFLNILKGYKS